MDGKKKIFILGNRDFAIPTSIGIDVGVPGAAAGATMVDGAVGRRHRIVAVFKGSVAESLARGFT